MSFSIGGVTYYPKTGSEHAQAMLASMNAQLSAASLPILSASQANALWWVMLAFGTSLSDKDAELQSASQSFDIANCDDNQILNLLPIAGTSLIPATYSSVALTVTATSAGAATVTAGSQIRYGTGYFVVQTTTVVPLGSTVNSIVAVYTATGPVQCSPGQLTAFVTPIANVASVTNAASAVPGRDVETIPEVRTRLTLGGSINAGLVGAIAAIRMLPGITNVNIYFNISTTVALTLPGSISVPVRSARVFIQGSNASLAETYFKYMSAPTSGASSQNWITPSAQTLTLSYDAATVQNVYVRTRVLDTAYLGSGYKDLIRNVIYSQNATAKIGELVTVQELGALFIGFNQATVLGFEISLDGSSWASYVEVNANSIPVFTADATYMPIINQSGTVL
jgi:hypothetical protein